MFAIFLLLLTEIWGCLASESSKVSYLALRVFADYLLKKKNNTLEISSDGNELLEDRVSSRWQALAV